MTGTTTSPPSAEPPVHYVLEELPRLSGTSVLREVLELEAQGRRVLVDSLRPPEPGPRDAELERLRARVRVLPRHPRLRDAEVRQAQLAWAARRPLRWSALALRATARAESWRRFLQAGLVADRAHRAGARNVHADSATAAAVVARDAGALADRPVTVTARGRDVHQEGDVPLLRSRLTGVRAVVAETEHDAEHLRTVLPRTPVRVVRTGVPLQPPREPAPAGPVLCVSRLVPDAGIDTLITAFGLLAYDRPRLTLEIIGGGPLDQPLRDQVALLGLPDRVRFRGPLPGRDVRESLRGCSFVVLPGRIDPSGHHDGVPWVLLESMAVGVPVVTTAIPGPVELVRDGASGLLVPPDAPSHLAVAMARLLDDPAAAAAMGRAARRVVAEQHSPRRTADELQRLWRDVTG